MPIHQSQSNGILTITISRPDALNALNSDIMDGLGKSIQEAYHSKTVKVIILIGDGEKHLSRVRT